MVEKRGRGSGTLNLPCLRIQGHWPPGKLAFHRFQSSGLYTPHTRVREAFRVGQSKRHTLSLDACCLLYSSVLARLSSRLLVLHVASLAEPGLPNLPAASPRMLARSGNWVATARTRNATSKLCVQG